MNRLYNKDEDALTKIMNEHGNYLMRTAYLLLKDHHLAEEAVQDTFVIAFKKIDQLKEPEKLKSWLTTIVMNQCRARARKWEFKHILPWLHDREKMTADDEIEGPEEVLMQAIQSKHVSTAIGQLPYKYREVITLYYYNEMKIQEISIHIKTKENTVKSRLTRARSLLRHYLMEGEEEDEETTRINKGSAR